MLIYISTFFQPSQKLRFQQANKNFNPYSAHNMSYAIFDGLSKQMSDEELVVINITPVGFYPLLNKIPYIKDSKEVVNGIQINSIGFCNLYLYQHLSISNKLYHTLKKSIPTNEEVTLLIYSLHVPALKAIEKYKRKVNPQAKIIIIIPDFLEDMYGNSFKSSIKMKMIGDSIRFYNMADGFVLLTEQMTEKVGRTKPYCVVEGLYNSSELREKVRRNENIRKVFYSGMLYSKFGVKNLVDAFSQLDMDDISLQLCGCGELEQYIKEISEKDKRIEYMGMLSRDEVLALQSNATLLVNPRQPIDDFTKYSFPSKNIEYMASGTPLLMYKLPGVPEEYYSHCFSLDYNQLGVEDMKNILRKILTLSNEELFEKGKDAQNFIYCKKNSKTQCEKIVKLLNNL